MKKILVTGAAGFLGNHLVEHHLNLGHVVYGVDNFCSSNPLSCHHQTLLENLNYHFFNLDICSPRLANELKSHCFDVIYNFACPASPPVYQSMPIQTMMTCVLGTKNVLELAGDKTIVVHASTSEVYGDPAVSPQSESYRGNVNSYGPRACYDEGKRAGEAVCYDFLNKFGVDVRLVRIFNTYGPRMDPHDGRVITNLVMQGLSGKPLTIYGDGLQTRSFCYVTDTVRGIVALANQQNNPRAPINIGNPDEYTILELAQKVMEKLGGNIRFIHPAPTDDPLQRKPDIKFARELLGWYPNISIDDGLERMFEYYKGNHVI